MMNNFKVMKGDMDNAIAVMNEVARWCEDTGKKMWTMDELSKEKLLQGIEEENFWVGKVGHENAAAMIVQWYDPLFWPRIERGESGFIHKLCVRRKYSGIGLSQWMINWAMEECKQKGIRYLRLDTGWNRYKLCSLYESFGFVKVGRKTIRERDYALYEMEISDPYF